MVPKDLLRRHPDGHVEEPGPVPAEAVRVPAGDAAGTQLHQHLRQPRTLLEAHQTTHATDHSG